MRGPRPNTIRLLSVAASLAVAAAATTAASSCASHEPAPERPRILGRPVAVLPVEDRSGALAATETALLRRKIEQGLRTMGEGALNPGRAAPLAFPVVESPTAAALLLEVRVLDFDPEGSLPLALTVGLGAGRPSFEVELRLAAPPGTTGSAEPLGDRIFERSSRRWERAPADAGGARGAMIGALADEAVGFVRRRR